ncbi:MAG: RNA polymerase sigma factor, partial [Nakamurella sp.]
VPDNPAAWLTTTAHRRALDVLRRRRTESDKLRELTAMASIDQRPTGEPDPGGGGGYADDRLQLLFACCHPALPLAGRVALTLKTVGELSTGEVASAFLVSEATMGQRLLRTKSKIAHTGIALRVPEPHRIADRIAGVLTVIYLIFNEGYSVTGENSHDDLAGEAVRLAGLVARLLPEDDEVLGLAALLRLQHARRATRTDSGGDLLPMEEQDRSRWDNALLADGLASLAAARASGRPAGPYRLQAEIAAEHATAETAAATDWISIVADYDALLALQPSPVVALNRAIAVGFRDGPEEGLRAVAQIDGAAPLTGYHLLPATRADLLRRAGRADEAAIEYREAIGLVRTDAERRFLERRLRELSAAS